MSGVAWHVFIAIIVATPRKNSKGIGMKTLIIKVDRSIHTDSKGRRYARCPVFPPRPGGKVMLHNCLRCKNNVAAILNRNKDIEKIACQYYTTARR